MKTKLEIHVIYSKSKVIVFHPESFTLFYVPNTIGEILKFYETVSKETDIIAKEFNSSQYYIDSILDTISEMVSYNFIKEIEWRENKPKSLNLIISQDCNLKCIYCYAEHGTYGCNKKFMDINTAKLSVDKLFNKNFNNSIVFFGGEPFLNFPLIKELDSYLTNIGLKVKYMAITNGTVITDEIIDFINKKFSHLCISLDGTKEINDQQRYGNVESVHDRVIETITKLKQRNYAIIIRSVATKKSIGRLTNLVEYLSSLDVDSIGFEPVQLIDRDSNIYISDENFIKYIKELSNIHGQKIQDLANGNSDAFMSYIYYILRLIVTKTRNPRMCSGGREFITIAANGDVYPCHMFIGDDDFKMGNVHDDDFPGDKFERIRERFYEINVYNSRECSICWARFLCGGGCVWQSYTINKDLFRPADRRCLEMKSIIEALLPEIAEIFQDEIKTKTLINSLKSKLKSAPKYLC